VDLQHLRQLVANAKHWVEATLGLLEDHRDAIATDFDHARLGQGDQILVVEEDAAVHNPAWLANEAHDR